MPEVGIILGSDSDLPKIKGCFDILEEFGIDFEIIISSAHRTPEKTMVWAFTARGRGIKVIIAAAGGAAHLPGVVASQTTLPVIGIPIETTLSGGLDSILSILQMPSGIPVGVMPAGKAGGTNAALYAINILSIHDEKLAAKIEHYRVDMAKKIKDINSSLASSGYKEYIKGMK